MNSSPDPTTKNLLEWTVFGISSVIVLTILVLLTMAAITVKEGSARLRAETGKPLVENGWLRIPITVANDGERVAANVEVQVCIGSGAERREAGFSIDFVPRGATRNGSVSFKGTELPQNLECEVLGYEEP
ncbi:MAG: hypothetical protein V4819_05220 [Verrucomicrobiota bacterium]